MDLAYDIGYGTIVGFTVGFALKRVFKFFILITGIYLLSLVYLSEKGIINVNWEVLHGYLSMSVGSLNDFIDKVAKTFAFSGAFIGGFVIGLRV